MVSALSGAKTALIRVSAGKKIVGPIMIDRRMAFQLHMYKYTEKFEIVN